LFTLNFSSDLHPTNNANHNNDEPMGPSAFRIQPPEMGSVHHGVGDLDQAFHESSPPSLATSDLGRGTLVVPPGKSLSLTHGMAGEPCEYFLAGTYIQP
jgi:hypothetical protein